MHPEKLQQIADRLMLLYKMGNGNDEAARNYLDEVYPTLPENLQREIALLTFIDAMDGEVQEREIIARIQEAGVTAAEALEKMKGGLLT